ncbi:MAG: TonB-dependent receptor, partial [Bacteroidales bacterium]|nr:TonB-dependent receptor [Bacteroidales bacterium]
MKKILCIYLIIIGLTTNVRADDDNPPSAYGSISGIVVDAASNEPLPYVNVVVRNSSDSILTGGITDDKGTFMIKAIPEGNNKVEIQFIGYEKITTEVVVSPGKARHNLSTITLNESSQQLEEVVVRGELSTVTQKIDRKVINVGKDLTSTGTTASELLNNVQSVSVDGQTGNISLRGNENVKILVDGRPTNVSAAQLLQQIPSSSIKSIELITNPSAKYSPEGMSGIINIVLYKNATLGLNGSVNGGLSVGRNVKYNGALDLNYHKGMVNLFANYGGNTGKSDGGGELTRTDNSSYSDFFNANDNTSHLFKAGADLYLNKSNTLSFYTTQNLYDGVRSANTMIYFEEILDSDNPSENVKDNYTGSYNLNFKHDFGKAGHNIEFEVSHSLTDKNEDATFDQLIDQEDLTTNYIDDIHDDVTSTVMNLDYTNPLSENAKLELGLETRYSGTRNRYNTDRHRFLYDEFNMIIPDGNDWFLTAPMGNSSFMY